MDFFFNQQERRNGIMDIFRPYFIFLFNFLVMLYTRTHALQEYYVGFFFFFFFEKINLSIFITIFIYLTGIYHCLDFRYIIIHIQTY
jgi:hypothetical protein